MMFIIFILIGFSCIAPLFYEMALSRGFFVKNKKIFNVIFYGTAPFLGLFMIPYFLSKDGYTLSISMIAIYLISIILSVVIKESNKREHNI